MVYLVILIQNVGNITMTDKQSKFVRLTESRVNTVIKGITLIGNLSNKRNYEYTDEQANKIILELESEKNLQNSSDDYQKLIRLNNLIEKKFQKNQGILVKQQKKKLTT